VRLKKHMPMLRRSSRRKSRKAIRITATRKLGRKEAKKPSPSFRTR
jgi:hypothetical protein